MAYYLGIDLGTTYTAAAVWRDGRVEIASLGTRAAVVPSVVLLREDGTVLVGEAAERRALTEPQRVAREFKRRFGDPTPIIVGGTPYSADSLSAKLLRWVVDSVVEREGRPPDSIVVSHPANWGPFKQDLLRQTFRLADLDDVSTVTEPEAAAIHYAGQERVGPGTTIAVYDLGGGTFDAALLRRTDDGWEILGEPEGIERLGGVDFDQAVYHHVEESLGDVMEALDPDDPTTLTAVARLRQECVEAKEALSSDVDAVIPVLLPNVQTDVRLTRSELESKIRPTLVDSIAALRRALRSASIEPEDLTAVLLVGGSSRVPLVAQLVGSELRRPVAVDAHPKHSVALGAAIVAAERGMGQSVNTEVIPSIETFMPPKVTTDAPAPGPAEVASVGPPTTPVVDLPTPPARDPYVAPPAAERHEPRTGEGRRVTVPAPPVRPTPSRTGPPTGQRPPAERIPSGERRPPERRPPQQVRQPATSGGGPSKALGFLLVAILLVAAAGFGIWWMGGRDDGDDGDQIDTTTETDGSETTESTTRVLVSAADERTVTGIEVEAGDTIQFTATGRIRDDIEGHPDRFFEPDGIEDVDEQHTGDPFAGQINHAALMGEIAPDGQVFEIGSSNEITADSSGELQLGVHDGRYDDNDGLFTVDITVIPG